MAADSCKQFRSQILNKLKKQMNQQPIKIAVFGLGGVGGYYGAMLALRAAATDGLFEVSWIARGAHLEAIRAAGGLRVVTPS